MISEYKIIKKIVELAKESASREIYIKQKETQPIEDSENARKRHDKELTEMKQVWNVVNAELRVLVELFKGAEE